MDLGGEKPVNANLVVVSSNCPNCPGCEEMQPIFRGTCPFAKKVTEYDCTGCDKKPGSPACVAKQPGCVAKRICYRPKDNKEK